MNRFIFKKLFLVFISFALAHITLGQLHAAAQTAVSTQKEEHFKARLKAFFEANQDQVFCAHSLPGDNSTRPVPTALFLSNRALYDGIINCSKPEDKVVTLDEKAQGILAYLLVHGEEKEREVKVKEEKHVPTSATPSAMPLLLTWEPDATPGDEKRAGTPATEDDSHQTRPRKRQRAHLSHGGVYPEPGRGEGPNLTHPTFLLHGSALSVLPTLSGAAIIGTRTFHPATPEEIARQLSRWVYISPAIFSHVLSYMNLNIQTLFRLRQVHRTFYSQISDSSTSLTNPEQSIPRMLSFINTMIIPQIPHSIEVYTRLLIRAAIAGDSNLIRLILFVVAQAPVAPVVPAVSVVAPAPAVPFPNPMLPAVLAPAPEAKTCLQTMLEAYGQQAPLVPAVPVPVAPVVPVVPAPVVPADGKQVADEKRYVETKEAQEARGARQPQNALAHALCSGNAESFMLLWNVAYQLGMNPLQMVVDALYEATRWGNQLRVTRIINAIQPNAVLLRNVLTTSSSQSGFALNFAAHAGYAEIAGTIINAAKLHDATNSGSHLLKAVLVCRNQDSTWNALETAKMYGHTEVIRILTEAEESLRAPTSSSNSSSSSSSSSSSNGDGGQKCAIQ